MDNTFHPFKNKKKISLDLNTEFLQVIDELTNLSKNSRSLIIEALIGTGIIPFFDYLEKTWKRYLADKKYEKAKKDIQKLLLDLKKIRKRYEWLNSDYYWKILLSK